MEEVLFDSSRAAGDMAVEIISRKPGVFGQAYAMCMAQQGKLALRAARVVQLVAEQHPELFKPYYSDMLESLPSLHHNAVKRSMLKILTFFDLPEDEDQHGMIIDTCFRWMNDAGEEIAIRAYAALVLKRMTGIYPEITGELMAALQMTIDNAKDTLSNWAGKMLNDIRREAIP